MGNLFYKEKYENDHDDNEELYEDNLHETFVGSDVDLDNFMADLREAVQDLAKKHRITIS